MENRKPLLTDEQIQAMVMAKYPKTERERDCLQERQLMKDKREWYRQQLIANIHHVPTPN